MQLRKQIFIVILLYNNCSHLFFCAVDGPSIRFIPEFPFPLRMRQHNPIRLTNANGRSCVS